ncbi:steroid 17-alpha-hydroxylase/17,20 lyase [Nematostella vectensis]|uniref:steroid 17-alpha-hydroxylase/17,20 lyase n=1 Tax=Nematostella vectensis TaxID=45351 RepID=UPI00207733DB|nr:steroid 17-alpha-hydroxylase/17,20 lyase [Nematostella vectensis]
MAPLELLSSLTQLLTLSNVFLFVLFALLLNFVLGLYEFRGMPPGPRYTRLPVIGNFMNFDYREEDLRNMTKSLRRAYGGVFAVQAGSFRMVFVTTPKAVKEVLVTRSADYAGRPPFYSFIDSSLGGKGLALGNYGPAWRLHRKLFTSSLRQYLSDIPLFESRVAEQARKLLKYFEDQQSQPFDPADKIRQSVADVICGITFGDKFNSTHPAFDSFFRGVVSDMDDPELTAAIGLLDLFSWAQYLPFEAYKEMRKGNEKAYDVLRMLLDQGKKTYDDTQPARDLMTALLQERVKAEAENEEQKQVLLADDYLLNQLGDMFIAGYETTSTSLRWAITFLVNYPEYQEEIYQQLDQVIGPDRMPTLADRPQLAIIQATIMEVLRVGNVADMALPHYTLKDTLLCGYRVPKDTVVLVDLMSVHMDPGCWDNPTQFNPHRHLTDKGELITSQGNFLPFSAGRRVCAGESLAKVELFLFLSWMLHKFRFVGEEGKPPPTMEVNSGFTQSPKKYKIRAIKRN